MPKDALTPQARHHFTRFDQVDQLVAARFAGQPHPEFRVAPGGGF